MEEKPRVVVASRSRRPQIARKEFSFSREMIPVSGALADYRLQAWQTYTELPIPNTVDEAWRRTDLRSLPADSFRLPVHEAYQDLLPVPSELLAPLVAGQHGGQVVLLPGGGNVDLEIALVQQGVIFTDLVTAEREHPRLVKEMASQAIRPEEGKFAALAGSLAQTGVVLYVPKGVEVAQPLHSILWGPGGGLAHISHLLVWLDEGASVTYVHESSSPDEDGHQALHAGLVDIRLSEGASLRFVELQSWGRHVWNFSHERVSVGRAANIEWIFGATGSRLTKNFSTLDMRGEGSTGRMSGFYFADGAQHFDHDTQQNHFAPNTTSDLLFKGALKGKSRSVWQGMIYVAPEAQKTDGYQANRNLVLSPDARADSIPGLEILADDVRCTHGATVSKLEEEPLFYLQTRGIPDREAERLMVTGFFDPIMQRVPFESVRERLQRVITEKMSSQ